VTGAPLDSSDPQRAAGLKRKVLARLTDVARHYRALEAAMAEFGDGFPRERFVQAAGADEPAALNSVKATERGLDQLFNYLAELGALGLELAGLQAPDTEPNARADLRRLREIDVIEDALCEQLVRVAGIRNRMVHDYVGLSGVEVHEAVRLLHGALPRYIAAYQDRLRAGFPPTT
jgi:uncharacterized protein YutE (UPF0331/DUF86 family)